MSKIMEALKSFETLPDSDKVEFFRLLGSLGESTNNVSNVESSASSQKSGINVLLEHFKSVPKNVNGGDAHVQENVQSAEPKKKQKTLDSWLIKKNETLLSKEYVVQKSNTDIVADNAAEQNNNSVSMNSSQDFFSKTEGNVNAKSINCKDGNVKNMQAEGGRLTTSPKAERIGVLIGEKSYNLRSKLTPADLDDNIKDRIHSDDNIASTKAVNVIDGNVKKTTGNEYSHISQDLPLAPSTANKNESDVYKMGNDFQTEQTVGSPVNSNNLNIPDMNQPSYKRRIRKKSFKILENENIVSCRISGKANVSDRINQIESKKRVHPVKPSVVFNDGIQNNNKIFIDSEPEQSSVSKSTKKCFKKLENKMASSNISYEADGSNDQVNLAESEKKAHPVKSSIVCDGNNISNNNKNCTDSEMVQLSVSRTKKISLKNKNIASFSISDEANASTDRIDHAKSEKKVHPVKSSVVCDDNIPKNNKYCTDTETVRTSIRTKKVSLKKMENENIASSSISDEANVSDAKSEKKMHSVKISVISDISKDSSNCTNSETAKSLVSRTKRSLTKLENGNIASPSVVSDDNVLNNNKKYTDSKTVQLPVSTTKKRSLKKLGNENIASSSISDETDVSDQIDPTESEKKVNLVKPSVVSNDYTNCADSATVQSSVSKTKKRSLKKLENENIVSASVVSDDNILKNNKNYDDLETVHSSENTVDSVNPDKCNHSVSKVSPRKSKRISSKALQNEIEMNDVSLSNISNQGDGNEQIYHTSSENNVYHATTIESDDTTSDKYCSDNSIAVTKAGNKMKEKYLEKTDKEINEARQLSQVLSVGFSAENIIQLHSRNIQNGSKTDHLASDTDIICSNDTSISNMSKISYNLRTKKRKSTKSETEIENSSVIKSSNSDLDTVKDQINHVDLEENINFVTNSTSEFNYDAFCKVKTALSEVGLEIYDILQNENVQNLLSDYEKNPCDDAVFFIGTHKSVDEKILPVVHTHVSKTKLLESLCEIQKILLKKK